MLARVTAALIKFIHPLSASVSNSTTGEAGTAAGFQRFKRKAPDPEKAAPEGGPGSEDDQKPPLKTEEKADEQKKAGQKPALKLVPPLEGSETPDKPTPAVSQGMAESSTQAFLEIFAAVKEEGNKRVRSLAVSTYRSAIRGQKKGRSRKGSILDRNID